MTTNKINFKVNFKLYLISEFIWNLGRTIPHSILTIYFLNIGLSIIEISLLQIIYMISIILFEFPSGVISDRFSRKRIYIISIILIFISYFIISINTNFLIISFAYFLYGLSNALKSGTLDSEVIIQVRKSNLDMKEFSILEQYCSSISSIIGAGIGSIIYKNINNKMYILSLVLFILSLVIILFFKVDNNSNSNNNNNNTNNKSPMIIQTKNIVLNFINDKKLFLIILISLITVLFLQPFFQFWQILYKEKAVPIQYFGIAYIIFQLCNIISNYIFNRLNNNLKNYLIIIISIPISFTFIGFFTNKFYFFFLFPIVILLFYTYLKYILLIFRKNCPEENISTYTSFIGTIQNIFSSLILLLTSYLIEKNNIILSYNIMFYLFAILSFILIIRINKIIKI